MTGIEPAHGGFTIHCLEPLGYIRPVYRFKRFQFLTSTSTFSLSCFRRTKIENNIITDIAFWGGCNGNLQGLSRLVKGMSVNDVISRLEGVRCGRRSTSCPDQLCRALHEMGF